MSPRELTRDNAEELITKSETIIIDFWASWCGPCRTFKPIFEAASEAHEGVIFATCDTEAQQELAASFEVRSIPLVAVLRDGVLLHKQPGALPAAALDELLTKVAELDMDEVRKDIQSQSA